MYREYLRSLRDKEKLIKRKILSKNNPIQNLHLEGVGDTKPEQVKILHICESPVLIKWKTVILFLHNFLLELM